MKHRTLSCWLLVAAAFGVAFAQPISAAAQTSVWSVVSSPNRSASQNNFLFGVSCVSSTDCWAVGESVQFPGEPEIDDTLTEHFNGLSWSIEPSPNQNPNGENVLNKVSCVAADDCWAVGEYRQDSGILQPLAEHYDGSAWSIVSIPAGNAAAPSFLNAVSCSQSNDCWVVGTYVRNQVGVDLLDHFDGTSWTIASAPDDGATQNVTCISPAVCWSVGGAAINHYDGTSWGQSTGTPALTAEALQGIACATETSCWATGYYLDQVQQGLRTVAERYDGTGWSLATTPNDPNAGEDRLNDVTCTGASACTAVGFSVALCSSCVGGGPTRTLIEQYNGSSWLQVASPSPSAKLNSLNGVSCPAATGCIAVGAAFGTQSVQTLIEQEVPNAAIADLSIVLRAASTSVVGHDITYRLHIANRGPAAASDVRVHFSLPLGTTFVSVSGNGLLDANRDSVRWRFPALAPGTSTTLTVTLLMDQSKSMRAQSSIRSTTPDPNLGNNWSSTVTRVS